MKLYNSLTKQKEEFQPIVDGQVSMYSCGPTVYGRIHVGNARAFVFADILKRALLVRGFSVKHVMNITDVDDKTIRDSRAAGESLASFTTRHTETFFADLKKLNVLPADHYPRATEYIRPMLILIEQLLEKGFAYIADDGSVYFDVTKDAEYGQLSHLEKDMIAQSRSRIKNDEYDKDSIQDFALWKAWDETDGEVAWEPSQVLGKESKIGRGRPGWHIECSAMSMDLLGVHFDIHTGGVDLMFPHHENEIAQSRCATGHDFVNYWLHNEHLMVDGKKMSKSLNNFYTLDDLEARGYDLMAFRYLTLQTHYRQKMNFTWEALDGAQTAYKKLIEYARSLDVSGGFAPQEAEVELETFAPLSDDLNTAEVLASLHALMRSGRSDGEKAALLAHYDLVLGLDLARHIDEKIDLPANIYDLLAAREQARIDKNWAESDRLRDEIALLGYEVRDTEDGQEVVRK